MGLSLRDGEWDVLFDGDGGKGDPSSPGGSDRSTTSSIDKLATAARQQHLDKG